MLTCGCLSSSAHMCKQNFYLSSVYVASCLTKKKKKKKKKKNVQKRCINFVQIFTKRIKTNLHSSIRSLSLALHHTTATDLLIRTLTQLHLLWIKIKI